MAAETTWVDVRRALKCSGSTVTTKLWRTWAKWHDGEGLPIAAPGRGRARAGVWCHAKGAKSARGRRGTPVPEGDMF